MTNETKELFDAPWRVEVTEDDETIFGLLDDEACYIATQVTNRKDAARIARLPELYDALTESTQRYCGICHNLSNQEEPSIDTLIENGCPKNRNSCVAMNWLELLKKVRDGV